jgi:GcrA cell cycle regulator
MNLGQSDWTVERVELLKQLWADGRSCSQIANEIGGITRNAVIGKVHRMGLAGRITVKARANKDRSLTQRLKRPYRTRVEKMKIQRATVFVAPIAPPAPPDFLGIELLDLNPFHCRFPSAEAPFTFCGQPRMAGQSYCPHCYHLTHNAPSDNTPVKRTRWVNHLTRWAA